VKITGVEAIVLESPKDYGVRGGEAAGPRFRSLLRVSTDEGIDGWAEVETQPHVLKAVIDAPGDGSGLFETTLPIFCGVNIIWPTDSDRLRCRVVSLLKGR